jgi:uncharacterized protein (TIGR03067 family)
MVLLLLVPTITFPPVREGPKQTPDTLVGKWQVAKWTMCGVEQPPEACKEKAFEFSETKLIYIWIFDGVADGTEYKLTFNPNAKPLQFDAKLGSSAVRGIFRVSGDTAEICWSELGAERPTQFVSKEKNTSCFQLKRIK